MQHASIDGGSVRRVVYPTAMHKLTSTITLSFHAQLSMTLESKSRGALVHSTVPLP